MDSRNLRAGTAGPPALPTLDLALVRALVALVNEKSVSRAAELLGQSQPQMSKTLRRMRTLLKDPILVRGSRGMAPTERAIALLAPAQRILNDTQTLLAAPEEFDPLAMRGTIQIAVPDFLSATLLAAIIGAIRAEAPQSTVRLRAVRSDADGAELLESGRADVLIESSVLPSAAIRYATLFEDSILAVAARGNPHATARLTCEEYLRLPHVAAAPASGLSPGMIDRMLAKQGHSRRVVAWVPYLNILPSVLAGSDLVFTTTAHLARHFASRPDLKTFVPPIAFPGIHYFLMWHECAHRSGKHVWLRNLIRHAVSTATVG